MSVPSTYPRICVTSNAYAWQPPNYRDGPEEIRRGMTQQESLSLFKQALVSHAYACNSIPKPTCPSCPTSLASHKPYTPTHMRSFLRICMAPPRPLHQHTHAYASGKPKPF
ncbi:hypothetical protein PIB30_083367 [Stylosanthes scabra]|uniref:Uncharacterized protein n=1 Tax=Stylosanthes scabra TaxID=79078 RepID=A0ABU6QTN9_9FABA|nr:hypothetical protein [Stylosanthes scabra]